MTAKELIETHIELIDKEEFDSFYDELFKSLYISELSGACIRGLSIQGHDTIVEVNKLLRRSGVETLQYLNYIPYGYFANSDLVNYSIPKHINKIDYFAFSKCENLNYIYIPSNVKIIAAKAFFSCNSLKVIEVDSLNDFSSIGFENESNPLKSTFSNPVLQIKGTTLGELEISSNLHLKNIKCARCAYTKLSFNVINIPSCYCYATTALKTLELSKLVEKIGPEAFWGCTSLVNIYYDGTIDEWNKVIMSSSSFRKVPTKVINCIDGITKLRH